MRGKAFIKVVGQSDVVPIGCFLACNCVDVVKHKWGSPYRLACQAVVSQRRLVRLRTCGVSGVTAFALAALRAKAGGDGSRTRVLKAIHTTFYMFRRSLISEWAGEPSRIPLQSIHVIDSPVAAVAPARASLLSSHSGLAGVGWNASWLIKPRERDFRNLHLVLFDPIFYEANESSSTCEPGFSLQVETFTPPLEIIR